MKSQAQRTRRLQIPHGFSLVELMIAIAIVGLLSAIAIPTYSNFLIDARRADATTSLADLASRMERHYTETNNYSTATIAADPETDILGSATTTEGHYTLSISAATATTFQLTAARILSSPQINDTTCADLTLSSTGVTGTTGTATADDCW